MMDDYRELRAEINKQKTLKDMTNKDLAKAANLAVSTVNGFMGGKRYSETVAERLSGILNIKLN